MEEQQAINYYNDQKSRGAGAQRFKHGLGFGGPQGGPEAPSAAAPSGPAPPGPSKAGATMMPGPPGHFPRPNMPPPMGFPPPQGAPPGYPPYPQPGMPPAPHAMHPPPPGHMPARPYPPGPGMPPPGAPHMRPPPPGMPMPGMRPPGPGLHGMMPPPHPGMMPPGMPPPHPGMPPPPGGPRPHMPGGGPMPPPPGAMMPPPMSMPPHPGMPPAAFPPPAQPPPPPGMHPAAQAAAEQQQRQAEEERRRAEQQRQEEARKRKEAEAWTAHKSEDGKVYYYNTLSHESSWERPASFSGDEAKVAEQPRPVASVVVAGTDWSEVKCHDGRIYYFNTASEESSWTVPAEVAKAKAKERQAREAMMQQAVQQQRAHQAQQQQQAAQQGRAPRAPAMGRSELVAAAQQQRASQQLSKEACGLKFKEMLLDCGVNAFSRWEKVLPKLEGDARWQLVATLKERRALFEDFCRNIAAEEKKLKEKRAAAAREGFLALLEEALHTERMVAAQQLLDVEEGEEGGEEQEGGEGAAAQGGSAEDSRPHAAARAAASSGASVEEVASCVSEAELELDVESLAKYWGEDDRWKAVSDAQRQQLFLERFGDTVAEQQARRQQQRAAAEAGFIQLLTEHGVTGASRWSKTREALSSEARYKALGSSRAEALFRRHVEDLAAQEEAAARRQAAEEAKMRAAQERAEAQGKEAEQRRLKAQHADAVAAYSTLLVEVVKDPSGRYEDWAERLARDRQARASNKALGDEELEELFRQHCASLAQRMTTEVTEALQQHLGPLHKPEAQQQQAHRALQHLEEADALLVDEPRWVHAAASIKEAVWDAYMKHLLYGGPPVASALPGNLGLAAAEAPAGPSGREGREWGGQEEGRQGRQQYDEYQRPPGRGYGGDGRGGYGAERGRDRDGRGGRGDDRRYQDRRGERYEQQYDERGGGRRREVEGRDGRGREEREGGSRYEGKYEGRGGGRSRQEEERSHKRSRH